MTLRPEKNTAATPARDAAREADIQELEQMWQENRQPDQQGLPHFRRPCRV